MVKCCPIRVYEGSLESDRRDEYESVQGQLIQPAIPVILSKKGGAFAANTVFLISLPILRVSPRYNMR